jgi:hypothetical protein
MPFFEIWAGNRESVEGIVLVEASDILLEDSEGAEACNAASERDGCDDFGFGSFLVRVILSHASKFLFVKRGTFVGLVTLVSTDSSGLRV